MREGLKMSKKYMDQIMDGFQATSPLSVIKHLVTLAS